MKEKKKRKWPVNLKPVVFLLPAAILVAVVLITLPLTAPILKELPEKLEYIMPVIAEAATVKSEKPTQPVTEKQPEAFFGYEDGVFTGSAYGYGGDIQVQVTVEKGYITDVSILSAPGETEPYFSLAKSILPAIYEMQTWEIDVISGATYSSKGILGAVQNAITGETVDNEPPAEETRVVDTETFKEPSAYKDGTYTGTAQGFGGPITVKVVIKNGKLKTVKVTDASGETPEYYEKAAAVIPAILKAGSPNVDTVSGATYSSSGIITAVKRALAKAAGKPVKETTTKKNNKKTKNNEKNKNNNKNKDKKKTEETRHEDLADTSFADGTFSGSGYGFGGLIDVEVTIKKGKITKIKIVSAKDETPEYFNKAKVITETMIKKQDTNVDTVSGATFSSEGIIEAVEQALLKSAAQYKKEHGVKEEETTGGTDKEPQTKEQESTEPQTKEPVSTEPQTSEPETESDGTERETTEEKPTDETETTTESGRYADGIYTGSAWCDGWPDVDFYYRMVATVTVEGGEISTIAIDIADDDSEYPEDNTPYINFAKNGRNLRGKYYTGIPQQIVEKQGTAGVDIVSGATYSSNSIIEAVGAALAGGVK